MPDNVCLETQQSKEIFGFFVGLMPVAREAEHSNNILRSRLSRLVFFLASPTCNPATKWWAYNFFPSPFAYTPFHSVNFLDVLEK